MAPRSCDSFDSSHCDHELTNCVFEMRRLLAICGRFLTADLTNQRVLGLALLGLRGVCGDIPSRTEINRIEVNRRH